MKRKRITFAEACDALANGKKCKVAGCDKSMKLIHIDASDKKNILLDFENEKDINDPIQVYLGEVQEIIW